MQRKIRKTERWVRCAVKEFFHSTGRDLQEILYYRAKYSLYHSIDIEFLQVITFIPSFSCMLIINDLSQEHEEVNKAQVGYKSPIFKKTTQICSLFWCDLIAVFIKPLDLMTHRSLFVFLSLSLSLLSTSRCYRRTLGWRGDRLKEEEMGCTSAKQVSAVPNGEESQNKAYSNGDLLSGQSAGAILKKKSKCDEGLLFWQSASLCHFSPVLLAHRWIQEKRSGEIEVHQWRSGGSGESGQHSEWLSSVTVVNLFWWNYSSV